MSKVISNVPHFHGFSGQSDFSATIDSSCSSEDLLYKMASGNPYFDFEDTKKTVTFGDVIIEKPETLYHFKSPREDTRGLLLSMFTHNLEEQRSSQARQCDEEETRLDEYEDGDVTINTKAIDSNSDQRSTDSSKNNDSDQLDSQEEPLAETLDRSGSNPLLEEFYDEPTDIAMTPTRLNLPNNDYILTPGQIISDMTNPNRMNVHATHKFKTLKRYKKQNAQLKEENKELIDKTICLTTCITAQQQNITNYEFFISNLQERITNMRASYELCMQKNYILDKNLSKAVQSLEVAQLRLQALKSAQSSREFQFEELKNIPSSEVYSETTFQQMKRTVDSLQYKNKCLQDVNSLLSKKMNGLYRFTVAPALHLLKKDNDDLEELLKFDSNNHIQKFLDSKYYIFENLQRLNMEVYADDDFDKLRERNDKKRMEIIRGIEEYFDKLSELVSNQFVAITMDL